MNGRMFDCVFSQLEMQIHCDNIPDKFVQSWILKNEVYFACSFEWLSIFDLSSNL